METKTVFYYHALDKKIKKIKKCEQKFKMVQNQKVPRIDIQISNETRELNCGRLQVSIFPGSSDKLSNNI
jgi:hypothetical protein